MDNQWNEMYCLAKQWAKEAAERIKETFSEELQIQSKTSRKDIVTNVDKEIEQFFSRKLNETFPEHKMLGEEGIGHDLIDQKGIVWIIDPIDGTLNFVHQKRNFAISIGIYEDGIAKIGIIYDVMLDEMYHAMEGQGAFLNEQKLKKLQEIDIEESIIAMNTTWLLPNKLLPYEKAVSLVRSARGTRSFGSAAIEIASVAAGRVDAYMAVSLAPWDIAGGAVIIKEVGGLFTTIDGKLLAGTESKTSLLVAKPGLHKQIIKTIKNP